MADPRVIPNQRDVIAQKIQQFQQHGGNPPKPGTAGFGGNMYKLGIAAANPGAVMNGMFAQGGIPSPMSRMGGGGMPPQPQGGAPPPQMPPPQMLPPQMPPPQMQGGGAPMNGAFARGGIPAPMIGMGGGTPLPPPPQMPQGGGGNMMTSVSGMPPPQQFAPGVTGIPTGSLAGGGMPLAGKGAGAMPPLMR